MTITINHEAYEAYIFDCDGTLADTMPLHYEAWSTTLAKHLNRPGDFTEEQFYRYGGIPARQIVGMLNEQYGYGLSADAFAHEKEECFIQLLSRVQPIPEVIEVLKSLGNQARVAVASGGLTPIVLETLKRLDISVGPEAEVKYVVGADQVEQGKPSPEMFLKAAYLLGAEPKRCLVFEDAEPGFAAARAAGMDYIDVRPYRATIHAAAIY